MGVRSTQEVSQERPKEREKWKEREERAERKRRNNWAIREREREQVEESTTSNMVIEIST